MLRLDGWQSHEPPTYHDYGFWAVERVCPQMLGQVYTAYGDAAWTVAGRISGGRPTAKPRPGRQRRLMGLAMAEARRLRRAYEAAEARS